MSVKKSKEAIPMSRGRLFICSQIVNPNIAIIDKITEK